MSGIPYAPVIAASAPNNRDAPSEVLAWLSTRGWGAVGYSQITGEQMVAHSDNYAQYLMWEQAVAYEFYRFINLGAGKQP